jgi:hypothetical protein
VLLVNGPSLTFGPNNLVSFNSKMVLTLKIRSGEQPWQRKQPQLPSSAS